MHATRGLLAGIAATVVLSVLMIGKAAMGLLPAFNAIEMLAGSAHNYLGIAASPAVGWVLHILIGVVLWGLLFAALEPKLPGASDTVKGLSFGVLAWVLMMIGFMPLAGVGFFGTNLGIMVPIMTLVLHLIYGVVLGTVFGWQSQRAYQHSAQP